MRLKHAANITRLSSKRQICHQRLGAEESLRAPLN
jgi:hypothetical protein